METRTTPSDAEPTPAPPDTGPETPEASPTERRRKPKRHKGLVVVNTGNGKGKSTAAFGLAMRAAGNRLRVLIVQFIKGRWKTGEQSAVAMLAPYVEIYQMGRGFTVEHLRDERIPMEDHTAAAAAAFAFAREALLSGRYAMVILDEILGAIRADLVPLDDVLALIGDKPEAVHLVLTGRGAPEALLAAADMATEMREIKHHYRAGITAQRGIEF
jgi:cob(I)alamin adenosyltransferase